jgi:hypothetical protein
MPRSRVWRRSIREPHVRAKIRQQLQVLRIEAFWSLLGEGAIG